MDMYTLQYLKRITNKDLLYSTGNSAQCYVAACIRRVFGGEWTHVYVCCPPETVMALLICSTPVQNRSLKKDARAFLEGIKVPPTSS